MTIEDLIPNKTETVAPAQKQEQPKKAQNKPVKPQKPKVDHSIPPRERIAKERDSMKFQGIMLQDFNKYAVQTTARLILLQFDLHPELEKSWDENEWTLQDFQGKIAERMRKECQEAESDLIFSGDERDHEDPLMKVFREIMATKNEPKKEPKIEAPKIEPKKKDEKPKKEPKPEQAKQAKKEAEQLLLDLGL